MVTSDQSFFPRVVDLFPPLKPLPGCAVPVEAIFSSSLSYSTPPAASQEPVIAQPLRHVLVPSPSDDEDIAIPSGMPASTKQADLPTIPPPAAYWQLKKLDPSANVMDYWIKSRHEWDIDGIESDIAVCQKQAS